MPAYDQKLSKCFYSGKSIPYMPMTYGGESARSKLYEVDGPTAFAVAVIGHGFLISSIM